MNVRLVFIAASLASILLVGRPSAGAEFYVDGAAVGSDDGTSWTDAYTCLQSALSAAGSGDAIRVASGIYKPSAWPNGGTSARQMHFTLINGVTILGGYPSGGGTDADRAPSVHVCVLSADIGEEGDISDNCYHVFYHPPGTELDASAVIDGFTITGGNANDKVCTPTGLRHGAGGGVHNEESSSPTLIDCSVTGNSADYGGGIYNSLSSETTLIRCRILDNSATYTAGGIYNRSSNLTMENCVVSGNAARAYGGGGILSGGPGSPMLIDCSVTGNSADYGGGIYNIDTDSDHLTLRGCNVCDNSAAKSGGGLYNSSGSLIIENCAISGNRADWGGGLYNMGNSVTLTNCVISDNSAVSSGGGICGGGQLTNCALYRNLAGGSGGGIYTGRVSSMLRLTHCTIAANGAEQGGGIWRSTYIFPACLVGCVVWGNSAENAPDVGGGAYSVTYSCLQGGYVGSGNIDADPLFFDLDADDFRLGPGSPCIDAGDNGSLTVDTDLGGNVRRLDDPSRPDTGNGTRPIADIGAYEYGREQSISFPALPPSMYGDSPFALTAVASSGRSVAFVSSDPAVAAVEADTVTIIGAGTATLTASQAGGGTWLRAEDVPRAITVEPAPLTCTAVSRTRTYGSPNAGFRVTYTGLCNGDAAPLMPPVPTCSADTLSGVGVYPIVLNGGHDPNYAMRKENGTLTVGKRLLTVTAQSQSRLVGRDNPPLALTYTGFVNGDLPTDLAEQPEAFCAADASSPAGSFPILVSGGVDENYEFGYKTGTLMVLQGARLHLWVGDGTREPLGIEFGEHETATDGFDGGLDEVVGHSLPGGLSAYLYCAAVCDPAKQFLSRDFRPCRVTTRWRLVVSGLEVRTAASLGWDVTESAPGRALYLQALRDERPVGFPVHMVGRSELTITEDGVFEIAYTVPVSGQVEVAAGWNLIGNPIMSIQSASDLLENKDRGILKLGGLWTWDGRRYVRWDTGLPLVPERGFWAFFPASGYLNETAGVRADGTILLCPGWNLVSPAASCSFPETAGVARSAWYWDAECQGYVVAQPGSQLIEGRGYWFLVTGGSSTLIHLGK